ncbi:MAG: GIY-YIG nuclease family protein [bacterium]
MHYTYILKSKSQQGAIYIGSTHDLEIRLARHNDPANKKYSRRYAPWDVETYIGFQTIEEAERFEKYLKSNSGKAFMRKRLLSGNFKESLKKFNNARGKSCA